MDVRALYKILNLRYGASQDEVKNAYRQLAKKYHPDVNPSEEAKQKFIQINKAYQYLINLSKDYFIKEAERKIANDHLKNRKNYHDEEFHRRARERARAKHEQMKQKQEDFKKSGVYDILLLIQYVLHYMVAIAAVLLIFFPLYISFTQQSTAILYLFFFWVTGGVLGYYIIVKRQEFFKVGKFYYTLPQLRTLIFHHSYSGNYVCYYCKNHVADALPYKVHLLKLRDIVLDNKGPLQHNVGYKRRNVSVVVPRSRKAFIIHSTSTFIRIFSIITALIFFNIDSIIWRFILGLLIGTFLSFFIQFLFNTKARNSYIFTFGFVTKISIWLTILSFFSSFDLDTFNIYGSEKIGVMVVLLFLVDPLLEGVIKFVLKKKYYKPLVKQPPKVEELIKNNFQYYLEISGWSMLYPITKWIFG